MPKMENTITKLRKQIKDAVPQDRLQLLPGEFHVYTDPQTGVLFKSVTTKLKIISNPIFTGWRMNRALEKYDQLIDQIKSGELSQEEAIKIAKAYPEEVFEKAGQRGTLAHGYVNQYLTDWMATNQRPQSAISYIDGSKGNPQEEDFAIWSAVRSFEDWVNQSGFIPLASEIRVWSVKYQEAGTLDAIGLIGDDLVLVDFKTSNSIDREDYWLQVACYYQCFKELTGLKCKYAMIVKLDKEQGKYDPPTIIKDLGKRFLDYKAVSKVYDVIQKVRDLKDEARNKTKKVAFI